VLDLNYLDLVFDCHEIDKLDAIKENSLDVITLTNALDHLKRPIVFLNRAANKLKLGGKVIATEPFFSAINCHLQVSDQEALDFRISEPELGEMQGPLASANIALPWLIFFRRRERPQPFNDNFDLASLSAWPFSALYGPWWNVAQAAGSAFSLSHVIRRGPRHQSPLCPLLRSFFQPNSHATLMSTGSSAPHCP